MKRLFLLFVIIMWQSCENKISAQMQFGDYLDGVQVTVKNTTYKVTNKHNALMNDEYTQKVGLSVVLQDIKNHRIDKKGEYRDGTLVTDNEEISGIIQANTANDNTIYSALRSAFTKEELSSHPRMLIWVFFVANSEGWIEETASLFWIRESYVIQPEQIHALENYLKEHLKFTLNEEKAAQFNWFEGQIVIRFRDYIEDRLVPEITTTP